jgi:hypothetical protein
MQALTARLRVRLLARRIAKRDGARRSESGDKVFIAEGSPAEREYERLFASVSEPARWGLLGRVVIECGEGSPSQIREVQELASVSPPQERAALGRYISGTTYRGPDVFSSSVAEVAEWKARRSTRAARGGVVGFIYQRVNGERRPGAARRNSAPTRGDPDSDGEADQDHDLLARHRPARGGRRR